MRRNLYVAEMAAAKREFDRFAVVRAQELLEKYLPQPGRPDLRGFEWRWLWNQCHRELFHLAGGPVHEAEGGPLFRDMRFSADGKWLASGATDGNVRLWNLATKRQAWHFKGGIHCNAVDFSADGRLLLASFYKPIAPTNTFVWDIANPNSPTEVTRITAGVRFLPDRNTVVADNGAEFDLSGKQIGEPYIKEAPPSFQLWVRNYSKDWKTVATNQRIWDVPTRKLLAHLPLHVGYLDVGPDGVAISPVDSNLIATGCPEGVRLWDRDGNQIGKVPGTTGTPLGWLSFSADGSLLAVRQYSGAVRVFETDEWTEVDAFSISRPDSSVLFSPVENSLFVAGGDDGVIRAYDVSPTGVPDVSFEHSSEVLALKFTPDGRLLVAGAEDGSVRFWDVASRTQVYATPATASVRAGGRGFRNSYGPDYIAISPDSRYVAIAGNEAVSVWGVEDWRVAASWTFPESEIVNDDKRRDYWAVCFSKDGTRLFGCNFDSERVDVWEWPNKDSEFRPVANHSISARCLDASAAGLLAGVWPKLKVWRIPDMHLVRDGAPRQTDSAIAPLINLAFSPDGRQLAVSDLSVDILDVSRWRSTATLRHSAPIEHVSWSPDGTRIAASDIYATTKLWDLETQKAVATFRGSISAFSPNGTILAVGGQGSKYIGDVRQLERVTLYYAPPLEVVDRGIAAAQKE